MDLAVVALTGADHAFLSSVWKFFPFQPGARFHYLYVDSGDYCLPKREEFAAIPLPEDAADAAKLIQTHLKNIPGIRLCFASLASFRAWQTALGVDAATLYYDGNHNLLDLADVPARERQNVAKLPLDRLQNSPAALCGEETPFGSNAAVHADLASFFAGPAPALLLTANSHLCASAQALQPSRYSVFHLCGGELQFNLASGAAKPDFLLALNRLAAAAEGQGEIDPDGFHRQNNRSYSFFADYYDDYMSHVCYDDWVGLMLGWYRKFCKAPLKRVLELACGTANASEIMVFKGLEVDACDSSPFMLNVADRKAFKPSLYLASMVDPIPRADYDLIFCLFDSINYLERKADARTLIANASAALKPGGIFIFDISTLMNSLQNFNETISYNRVRDGYIVHTSDFEPLSYRQLTHLTLFRKSGLGFERFEERHSQRVYRVTELIELIAGGELKLRGIFSPDEAANLIRKNGNDLDNRHARLFFVLQKDA